MEEFKITSSLPIVPDDFTLIVIEKKKNTLIIEPFTWAWFGLKIVEGIISGAAGFAVTKFIEYLSEKGETPEGFLGEVFERFGREVEMIISANELRKTKTLVNSLATKMEEYMNNTAGRDRLELATNDSQDLVSELMDFELAGHPCFMVAASLRIGILQERAKIWPSEETNIHHRVRDYMQHAERMEEKWIDLEAPRRVTEIQCENPGTGTGQFYCWYSVNGRRVGGLWPPVPGAGGPVIPPDRLKAMRAEDFERIKSTLETEITTSSKAIRVKWEELLP